MKKRYQEAKVKAVKQKQEISKMKVAKQIIAIEKVEVDNTKKRKLAFLLSGKEGTDKEGNKKEVDIRKVGGNKKEVVDRRVEVDKEFVDTG
jgi:hypothetical protein